MSTHLDPRQIDALLDGEWGPSARRHIETCADCRAAFERQRQLRAARDLAAPPTLSAERSRAMQARFAAALDGRHGEPRPRAISRPWLAAASIGGLLVLSSAVAALLSSRAVEESEIASHDAPQVAPTADTSPATPALEEALLADLEKLGAAAPAPGETEEPTQLQARSAELLAVQEPRATEPRSEPNDTLRLRPRSPAEPSGTARVHGQRIASAGDLETAATTYLDALERAEEHEQIALAFAAFREFCAQHGRAMEPRALTMSAERVASLALPAPYDEEAAYLACESALAAQRYEPAYRICSTYLERFPRGPRARDVAYLTATVARRYLGDCRAAVTRYTQALMFSGMLQSFNDEAYFGRALCHAQLGQQDAARADLDLYLHKRPSRIDSAEVKALAEELGRPSSPVRDR